MDQSTLCSHRYDKFEIFAWKDDEAIGRHVLAETYEPEVTELFNRHVRPGMYVVDVGANIGYFTMLAASLVGPSGIVDAIEANPQNARMIEASRRRNGFEHVRVANVAASNRVGLLRLRTDYSNGVVMGLTDDDNIALSADTVPAIQLSSILMADRQLDFLKIDIEGGEFLAMSDCTARLTRDVPFIVSEFTPAALAVVCGVTADQYLSFLVSCGFHLGVVLPTGDVECTGTERDLIHRAVEASGSYINITATRPGLFPVKPIAEPYCTDPAFYSSIREAWTAAANNGKTGPGHPLFLNNMRDVGYTRGRL